MTLRKTKRLITVLGVCTFSCVILAYLMVKRTALCVALLVLGLILAVAVAIINIIFWRCPYCGKNLGRDTGKFCQHCGKELNMDL